MDLGLAPGPRKYIQRFFDLEGVPGPEVKPPETTSLKIHRRVRIREATEEKTQKFWAGIEPWTSWSASQWHLTSATKTSSAGLQVARRDRKDAE